jgi:hypothetical protein
LLQDVSPARYYLTRVTVSNGTNYEYRRGV